MAAPEICSYLYEPLWWICMTTSEPFTLLQDNLLMSHSSPVLLFLIHFFFALDHSAVLAHILREKLHIFGVVVCALCVVGSTTIVLHAPQEQEIDSVLEVWNLATEPAFMCYASLINGAAVFNIIRFSPQYGQTCNECKSTWNNTKADIFRNESVILSSNLGIHIGHTYRCDKPVELLKQALDTFNTSMVSYIYYVMFTSLTILASVIMFKVSVRLKLTGIGKMVFKLSHVVFVKILSGTFLLHITKDMVEGALLYFIYGY
ncbi:unnamed protein product [Brassica napus]|uniref:Probable magnesium transporter n=1 Tax=Brassica napus TaxID=3708 RepID=A0A816Z3R2_BRANA|nr:unnamed protein product [Brassica napus]